jgi:putative GTP pyrophosphokinase
MISKRKIDQIGEILKRGGSLNKEEQLTLLNWRNSFASTLDYYHLKLKTIAEPSIMLTLSRRLKRIESIQIKLKRFSSMRLSTLQDIAGLRLVVKDENSLMNTFTQLRGLSTRHKLKRLDDYHNNPKNDGYRGIHLVYQKEDVGMVEIQLRTELEHVWATAVETYGELQNTSFKTGEGEERWKGFFMLLSSYFAIKENCMPINEYVSLSKSKILSNLKKSIKDLNVIERLNASTNTFDVIINQFNSTGRKGKYAILELDLKNKITKVELFNKKDVSQAIKLYTERELNIEDNNLQNIVFVNVENIDRLDKSYPNYFLNTKRLLEILSKIVLKEF